MTSALFFAVYVDDILGLLRRSKFGCEINGVFYGAILHADDILLLSGSRNGLQSLVNISADFAKEKNLQFGTDPNPQKSKSKCVIFSKKKIDSVKMIALNGRDLPRPPNRDLQEQKRGLP